MEEFLNALSRPPIPSKLLSLIPTNDKAGLAIVLTFSILDDEVRPIILKTPNLTIPYIDPVDNFRPKPTLPPKTIPPPKKPIQNHPPVSAPCVFFSHYMPKIFAPAGSDHESPIVIPHQCDSAVLKQLPMTKCIKHGHSGFLPYDYIRRLPEYTCTISRKQELKIVHAFDDCVLEFPAQAHPVGSSTQHRHQEFLTRKYCYQCSRRFSEDDDIYMLSPGCRAEASVTRYWYKKMMKALDRYLRSIGEYEEYDTLFTIDP